MWIYGAGSFFVLFTMSSTPFFLPAVVQEFGVDEVTSNLLSSLPYLFAVILLNVNSWHSDKTQERPFHIVGMCSIGIFGYVLVLLGYHYSWSPPARMASVCIAIAGQWSAMTPFVAWTTDCMQGNRAVGIAAVSSLGSIAGWAAPSILAKCKEYTSSYTLGLMVLGASLVCACATIIAAKMHLAKIQLSHSKSSSSLKHEQHAAEMEVLVSSSSTASHQE